MSQPPPVPGWDALRSILERARALGFLGPGPVERHLEHAEGFGEAVVDAVGTDGVHSVADLGSGGGIPALPLALRFPGAMFVLVEAGARRATFLEEAVAALGLIGRVQVMHERAETVGRDPSNRRRFDLVVSRGFGPPAVVAECAAPLLRVAGAAVISERPGGNPERWPEPGLGLVGMLPMATLCLPSGTFQVLRQVTACPSRFPRRVGVPSKRPLF